MEHNGLFFKARNYVKEYFDLRAELDDEKTAVEAVMDGVSFKGSNIIILIIAIFIASLRLWLLYLSLLNISVSCLDIVDIICLFKLPPNALYLLDIILTVKETDKPVIIHQLFVTSKLDKIHHKCFEYFNGRLTEKEQPAETVGTMKLKQEFMNQFDFR